MSFVSATHFIVTLPLLNYNTINESSRYKANFVLTLCILQSNKTIRLSDPSGLSYDTLVPIHLKDLHHVLQMNTFDFTIPDKMIKKPSSLAVVCFPQDFSAPTEYDSTWNYSLRLL